MDAVDQQTAIEDVLEALRSHSKIAPNIIDWHTIEAKEAQYADLPEGIGAEVREALRERGFERLYTHQAEAVRANLDGKNVVVVTPTASGKTLCYNIPVMQRLVQNPEARALYLFPTKALSHDQYGGLYEFTQTLKRDIKVYTFDGDTPAPARAAIRSAGQIVVTNPDMLHGGILPHHTKWIKLFENLETVVIDEMHQYRGIFGSHLGNVIRRLKRICEFYGSNPKFVCCSATIANPKEMAEELVEQPFELVDQNGAPRGERVIIFYNPPVVNKELGIRASAVKQSRQIALRFIERGLQTIIFARSRVRVEVLTNYLKDSLKKAGKDPRAIQGYRGGYLPNDRRAIEKGLRDGSVLGVVSTNALELGIDIGSLQVAVITGYPGTIASTWQQGGRAGRQLQTAVVVLVANSAPLDQFLMSNPKFFYDSSPEHAVVNPDNIAILASHLRCALAELPIEDGEVFGSYHPEGILNHFEAEGIARRAGGKTWWNSDAYPAESVSLRTATPLNFLVHDTGNDNRILAEVDFDSAQEMIHEEAIYLHQGRTFFVDKLDWDRQRAYVRLIKADYYTDAITKSDLFVLTEDEREELADDSASPVLARSFGAVKVTTTVPKYKKIKFETHESIGYGDILLPEIEMQTEAAWWTFRPDTEEWLKERGLNLSTSLKGLGWLIHNIAALYVMCDPRDIAALPMVRSPFDQRPTLYLYDKVPGGIGLARRAFGMDRQIMKSALEVAQGCPCTDGCPACIGPAGELGDKAKQAAAELLAEMVKIGSDGVR